MEDIETFAMEGLEGRAIGITAEQTEFELYSKIGIGVVAALMSFHKIMKFKRFRSTDWVPVHNSADISPFAKASCDVFEKDLAPALMILVFTISSAAFHTISLAAFAVMLIVAMYLIGAYTCQSYPNITAARILLYLTTLILFITLMGNDHVFNDSTLPQEIEMHMTNAARARHGDQFIDRNHDDLKPYIIDENSIEVNGTRIFNNGT